MSSNFSRFQTHGNFVLVVDDEEATRSANLAILRREFETLEANSATAALECLRLRPRDIAVLLLDIKMSDSTRSPDRAGLEILPEIKQIAPDALVVIFSVVDSVPEIIEALHQHQAFDYLVKSSQGATNKAVVSAVKRACEHRRLQLLERQTVHEAIQRLLSAADHRDEETGAHIRRVGEASAILARKVGWPPDQVELIRIAAPMHDIGKIAIPDGILFKPRRLSAVERQVMQYHTIFGANILSGSALPALQMAEKIALCHHEKYNGEGYPYRQRLAELRVDVPLSEPAQKEINELLSRGDQRGEAIPECARIVAIVDIYDALTHIRTYRRPPRLEPTQAVLEMRKLAQDGHLDLHLFEHFLQVCPEIDSMANENPDSRA